MASIGLALLLVWAPFAKVVADQNSPTTYEYDPVGNLTRTISPLSSGTNPVDTEFDYDTLNRPILISEPTPAPNFSRPSIAFDYDGLDQTQWVSDPRGLETDYQTDGLGNTQALTSPDTGNTSKTYDEAGNLKASTDACGVETRFTYDALNRLTRIDYYDGNPLVASGTPTVFTYDGGPGNTDPTLVGQLSATDDEAGATTFNYDSAGRLIKKRQALTGNQSAWAKTILYSYGTSGTSNGKLEKVTYPSCNRIVYHYDNASRIKYLTLNPANGNGYGTNNSVSMLLIYNIQYTPTGQFYSATWGNQTSSSWSGIVREDNLDGRIESYHLGNPNAQGLIRTLQYDADWRVTAMTHSGSGTGAFAPANFDQTYSYDNLGRLTGYTSLLGSRLYS